jgi:sporulation protein YlmC with PRC-barrel domain
MSLQTGGEIAKIESAIFNPNNLKIEGFYCNDLFSRQKLILLTQDIRDNIKQGIVVNDHDVLSEPDELIRLQSVLELQFELLGKPVETVSKHKVGKVTDYAVDNQTLYVQKIYVGPSLIKSLTSGQLSVDRNQIVEITNRRIIIKDLEAPVKGAVTATVPAI